MMKNKKKQLEVLKSRLTPLAELEQKVSLGRGVDVFHHAIVSNIFQDQSQSINTLHPLGSMFYDASPIKQPPIKHPLPETPLTPELETFLLAQLFFNLHVAEKIDFIVEQ